MNNMVPVSELVLAAGSLLEIYKDITPLDIQNIIFSNEDFKIRIPLKECRDALILLTESGFLDEYATGCFRKPEFSRYYNQAKKNNSEPITATRLWLGNI